MDYFDSLLESLGDLDDIHSNRSTRWITSFMKKVPGNRTTESFAAWFTSNVLGNVSKESARVYLMSLKRATKNDELIETIKNIFSQSPDMSFRKTPHQEQAKYLYWSDFSILESSLCLSGVSWHTELVDWLRATIFTGLRPKEWTSTHFMQDLKGLPILKVKNTIKAKSSPTGHEYDMPKYRVIPLHQLDKIDLECIQRHLSVCKLHVLTDDYQKWFDKLRQKLYHTSKQCFPDKPKYNLYSGRHQFAANLKKSEVDAQQIALLMGQNNTQTARQNYGAKRNGTKSSLDTAVAESSIQSFQDAFEDLND